MYTNPMHRYNEQRDKPKDHSFSVVHGKSRGKIKLIDKCYNLFIFYLFSLTLNFSKANCCQTVFVITLSQKWEKRKIFQNTAVFHL